MEWDTNREQSYWTIKGRNFFAERNKALYKDRCEGMGTAKLSGKYNITTNQMYKIIRREEEREEEKNDTKEHTE